MPLKSVKMKIKKKKVPRAKGGLCSPRTDRHKHIQSEYRGHPFRVLGMFPSTYHQGSVQYYTVTYNTRSHKCIITYKTQLHTIHGHIQYQGPRNRGARATKVSFNSTKVPSQLTKSALSVNKNAFSV